MRAQSGEESASPGSFEVAVCDGPRGAQTQQAKTSHRDRMARPASNWLEQIVAKAVPLS